jgi:hypothetical protein
VAGGDRVVNNEVALEVELVLFLGVHGMELEGHSSRNVGWYWGVAIDLYTLA